MGKLASAFGDNKCADQPADSYQRIFRVCVVRSIDCLICIDSISLVLGRPISVLLGQKIKRHMSHVTRKPTFWFPTWSDTNQAVQPQKMARGLKLRISKVEGLYYLCSKNIGADQLRGYREADLRLCFRICKTLLFS